MHYLKNTNTLKFCRPSLEEMNIWHKTKANPEQQSIFGLGEIRRVWKVKMLISA